MIVKNVRYICDHCKKEVSKQEYEFGAKITMQVNLDNPNGGCGQLANSSMHICTNCSNKLGIENKESYHKYTHSQSLLRDTLDKIRGKIFCLFYKEEKMFKKYKGKYAKIIDVINLCEDDGYQKIAMKIEFDDGKKYNIKID